MTKTVSTVFIVDDDPSVRKGLARLIKASGLNVEVFSSGEEFLNHIPSAHPSCLIIDLCMPGLGGIELEKELALRGISLPHFFITGNGDILMSDDGVDFLSKPFSETDLFQTIHKALQTQRRRLAPHSPNQA